MMSTKFLNRLISAFIVLGLGLMLVGFGLDLIPGSSPGISAPQLMMIVAGLLLALISWFLRSSARRQKLGAISGKAVLIACVMVMLTLVMLEVALSLANFPLRYPPDIEAQTIKPLAYWVCDELGCRYDREMTQEFCDAGRLSDIHCVINADGFHDTDTFSAEDIPQNDLKILALGDSFTFGASAKLGSSYVETVESALDNALVWNLGMPATGTNQALILAQSYAPRMQPDVIMLGLYMNDFEDNLYPLDQFYRGEVDGNFALIRQYTLSPDGTTRHIGDDSSLLYRYNGVEPPSSPLEKTVGQTRLGTLLLNTLDSGQRMVATVSGSQLQLEIGATRDILRELQGYVDSINSEFVVLLIPQQTDIPQAGQHYQAALDIVTELGIPYLNPADVLDPQADYETPPKIHWVTSGHVKVGEMLADCFEQFRTTDNLATCEHITVPSP